MTQKNASEITYKVNGYIAFEDGTVKRVSDDIIRHASPDTLDVAKDYLVRWAMVMGITAETWNLSINPR